MIALDRLEQLDAGFLELIAADALASPTPRPHRDSASRNVSEKFRIVSRATAQSSNSTVPSRTSAMPEYNSWVLPRNFKSCARAASRPAGLEKRSSPSAKRLIGAEHQRGRAFLPPPLWPFRAPATSRRFAARWSPRFSRCRARRYRRARSRPAMPAASSTLRRTSLFEASTSGSSASHSVMPLTPPAAGGVRPEASSPPRLFPRSSGA